LHIIEVLSNRAAIAMKDEIQPLSKQNYPDILNVWETSVLATHHFLSEQDIAFYKPLILNEYLQALKVYGIRRSGTLAGFIGVAEDKIEMLFIHPDYFRQGLGRQLCVFAIRELNMRKVDVNEANPDAYAFYKKLGFDLLGRSEKDPSGNDFPILHLELSNYTN